MEYSSKSLRKQTEEKNMTYYIFIQLTAASVSCHLHIQFQSRKYFLRDF